MTEITQPILDAYLKAYNDTRDGVPGRHREAHVAGLQAAFDVAPTQPLEGAACYRPPTDNTRALLDGGLKRAFTYGAEWACSNPLHAQMDIQREFAARRFIASFYEPSREPVSDDPIGDDPDASGLGTVKRTHEYVVQTISQCFARSEMPEEYSPNTLRKAAFLIGDLADRLMKIEEMQWPERCKALYEKLEREHVTTAAGLEDEVWEAIRINSSPTVASNESIHGGQGGTILWDLDGKPYAMREIMRIIRREIERATLTPPADPKPAVPGNDAGMREALDEIAAELSDPNEALRYADGWPDGFKSGEFAEFAANYLGSYGYQVGARRLLIRAAAFIVTEMRRISLAPQTGSAGEDEPEKCFVCGVAFKPGDMVINDITEGTAHRDCAGPERESFVDHETEESIGPDEPLPIGYPWKPESSPAPAGEDPKTPDAGRTPEGEAWIAETDAARQRVADQYGVSLAQPAPVGDIRGILTEARSGLHAYTGGEDGACRATIARIDAVLQGSPAPVGEDETGVRDELALEYLVGTMERAMACRRGGCEVFYIPPGGHGSGAELLAKLKDHVAALSAAPAARPGGGVTGWHDIAADEARMVAWVTDRFGWASQNDTLERANRLLEEVVEMHQAVYAKRHLPAEGEIRANAIVTHVYGKEPGEPAQEMGGVMTCALALGANLGVPLDWAAKTEIARIEGLSKEHFDKRHQAKVDAGVAAQHERPAVSADVEARARRIAAEACNVRDQSGATLPDDIWRQAIPRAQSEIDFGI